MTARDDILALGKRIGQSIIGQETMVERLLLGLARQRPSAGRRPARPRQDARNQEPGQEPRCRAFARPVHARPAAGRHHRLGGLFQRGRQGRVQVPAGTDLRQPDPRRRDQPRAGQGAVGAARGDGGAAGHGRRQEPSAARALHGHGDAEPDRAGGHLSAARGPARPLPDACARSAIPTKVGGGDHAAGPRRGERGRRRRNGRGRAEARRRRRSSTRRKEIGAVTVSEPVEKYIVALVFATRYPDSYDKDLAKLLQVGVSPRGVDRPRQGFARLCLAEGPRLRHARRRQGDRPRRLPPSADPVLRGACRRTSPPTRSIDRIVETGGASDREDAMAFSAALGRSKGMHGRLPAVPTASTSPWTISSRWKRARAT